MNISVVVSSTLATVAYDETRELLQLEFNSHSIYQYFDVPATVYESLLHAPSKGNYFNQAIRGRFRYRRISAGQAALPEQGMAAAHRG
jgi:hypothetical protein